jgi:hypothetical protein
MDEYVDCPYCHAASPAEEFTAGFGRCPFCGKGNYELDGYMGHLGHRTAASNDDVTRAVRDATGINLSMTNAGGGTYVFDGRLDDGSWIVANDSDGRHYGDMLERTEDEKPEWDDEPGTPLGWNVGIYPNLNEDGEDTWMGDDSYPIHGHDDPDATVDDLSRVIQHALTTMPRNQRHSSLRAASPARWHPSGLGGGDRGAPGEHTFDWRDVSVSQDETDGVAHMTPEEFDAFTNHGWQADLENGHSLHIQEDDPSLTGSGKREYYPTIHHPGDPSGSSLRYPEETNLGKWFKSRAEAQAAIEKAYTEKYPIGSDAPRAPRDSGVDYDSLFKPDDLDDDFGHILGRARTAAGMSWDDVMRRIDEQLVGGEHHDPDDDECRYCDDLSSHIVTNAANESFPVCEDCLHSEGWDAPNMAADVRSRFARSNHGFNNYTDRTGSTMNRTAAIDFVAAQNTRDRDELLFRAHRHASQLTCRLTVPEAQRAVRAFVAAVNREALRTAAAPEDEACGDCGADAGEECRFYCTGKAAHDDEVAEGKHKEGSRRRTAAVMADFPDELMF